MKQLLTTLLLLLAVCGTSMAQRSITGIVTGDDGETLVGATIAIKGVARGTLSDFNGKYTLEVPDGAKTLVVSYTGYKTQEVSIGASNALDIVLETGTSLSEVVITATGLTRNLSLIHI